jgi:hypothetical protein
MGEATTGTFGPSTIKGTGIALIVLTSLVVGTRFVGSIRSFKDLQAEDYLLIVAYIFFLELSILYIYISPVIFRIAAVSAGKIAPYATISEDGLRLQTVFFVTTSSLWLCLWMVKFSLLAMYKRLLVGKKYLIAWWVIMGFCVLVWISRLSASLQITDQALLSLFLAAFSHRGSRALASMPGLLQANATLHVTTGRPSSVYTTHTGWIQSLI